MYIKDIIDNKSEVILITRPRRVGKTLNMSMLRYYFDMNQKDSKEMFNTVLNFKANETQIENAYVNGYYNEAIEFFKTFYGTTFKDNKYLEKTVVTGVSRVAKESIFSRSKQL